MAGNVRMSRKGMTGYSNDNTKVTAPSSTANSGGTKVTAPSTAKNGKGY